MHTQTHTLLSVTHIGLSGYLHKTCGTRKVWVPSVSGLGGTES